MTPADDNSHHLVRTVQDRIRQLLAGLFTGQRPGADPGQPRSAATERRPMAAAGRVATATAPRRTVTRVPVVRQGGAARDAAPPMLTPAEPGAFAPADVVPPTPFRPRLAPTTRTFEMSQLSVLDQRLQEAADAESMTAADLGLDDKLPAEAVLVALRWDGPPEYPYVHGHFSTGAEASVIVVDLHTHSLREISRRLGLRQVWGG